MQMLYRHTLKGCDNACLYVTRSSMYCTYAKREREKETSQSNCLLLPYVVTPRSMMFDIGPSRQRAEDQKDDIWLIPTHSSSPLHKREVPRKKEKNKNKNGKSKKREKEKKETRRTVPAVMLARRRVDPPLRQHGDTVAFPLFKSNRAELAGRCFCAGIVHV